MDEFQDKEVGSTNATSHNLSAIDLENVRRWSGKPLEGLRRCVHDVVYDQVVAQPDAEAICAHDGNLCYRELDSLSTRLACHLVQTHGIRPETLVPLVFEKTKYYVITIMAVLKAGAAFLPLDPAVPLVRLTSLFKKVKGTIILCSRAHADSLCSITSTILSIDDESISHLPVLSSYPEGILPTTNSNNQCYLIFTSGTTGEPKGTVIEHGQFCTSASIFAPRMHMTRESRVIQFAAHTFDASILEILSTLMHGGCVCIPDENTRLNNIVSAISTMRVNWALLTPSFVDFFGPESVSSLKTLVLGGEAMNQSHIMTWAPHTKLINAYGPSECSVVAVCNNNVTLDTHPLDIGTPLAHAFVTDPINHDCLLPVGEIGELLIHGPTLAREYLDNPSQTAKSFITNPPWLSQVMPAGNKQLRLYKTGDLVRQNMDGTLRFQGRKDQQVKVHGQRVELGEIEHHVNLNESVKHGLVVSPKAGHFKGRLISVISLKHVGSHHSEFIEVTSHQAEASIAREQLAKSLPSYMVPSVWLTVHSIPYLSSGKLDRKKVVQWLEGLSQEAYRQIIKLIELEDDVPDANERPATEMEALLRAIWSRVLNLGENQVSLGRSFLSFGGDSISAMQVMGHCAKKSVSLTVQDLLRARSITELARRAKVKNEVAHQEETLEKPFDLSPIQTLFFQRPEYSSGHFNQSFLLRVSSPIQEENLRSAIEVIIERHSMFRARFSRSQNDGSIQQRITSNVSGSYRMRCHRISAQDHSTPLIADSQKCLDPFRGPVFGADLFEVDGGDQLVFMVCHHLVIDLVSWRVILEEIEELLLDPSQVSLGDKPLAFQTWAQLQAEQAGNWDLNKVLPSQMPAGDVAFWGMKNQPDTYGSVVCEGFEIDAATTSIMLKECHDTLNTEPIDLLISALIYSFAQCFEDRPVPPIFTEGHGREPAGLSVNLSRTVGWFTTMYPIQVGSASSDPIETICHVKDYRRRVPHNGRPYFAARCLSSAGKENFGLHWPSEITFNYLGQYQQLERQDALLKPVEDFAGEARAAGGIADVGVHTPRFALFEISAVIVQGKLRFSFTFSRNIHHQERIRHWITECSQAVATIANGLMEMKAQATPTDFPSLSVTYEDLRKLNEEILPQLAISSIKEVEGIFPCSSIQTGLFLAQTKDPTFYQDHVICKLQQRTGSNADAIKLAEAWQSVIDRHSALRTIFIEAIGTGDGVYNQLVLKNAPADIVHIQCDDQNGAVTTLQQSFNGSFRHNAPPHRFTICQTSEGDVFCKIDISHTIIDGKSISLILRDLALAYEGSLPEGQGPLYSDYIDYLQSLPAAPGLEYWKEYLEGVSPCEFPVLNDGLLVIPKQLHSVQYRVEPEQLSGLQKFCEVKGFTFSNLLNAAWALTLRCMTGANDVSFGFLSSGRNDALLDNIEFAIGPHINMLVHRSRFLPEMKINDILRQAQTDYMEGLPYHNTSLADVQHALHLSGRPLFDTSLSYQRSQHTENEIKCEVSFPQVSPTYDPTEFAININIEATENLVDIDLAYWTDKISDGQASNIGSTFLHVLCTIPKQADQPLSLFNFVSEHHHEQLMKWNDTMPPTINECVHQVIEQQTRLRPDAPAICAWDKDFTYAELDDTSSHLAAHLVSLDAAPGTFVGIMFDKSAWAIVALVATLKTGAAAVTLDPRFPKLALEHRIRDVKAQIVLASPSRADLFSEIVPHVIQVSQSSIDQLSLSQPRQTSIRSKVKPTDPFSVIYTSGSTGEPKGVVLEHRAFMSSSNVFGSYIRIDSESRVLQFSQYTFDVSLAEIFTTLTRGGCVCVLSEHERYNDLAGAINRMGVNHLNLTPTVAGLLRPQEVPNVKALCLAGEATTKENIEVWGKLASSLYGPSECSVHSTYNGDLTRSTEPTNVGRPTFFNWIVDPDNHNILRPIGCTGEILVEGPLLASQYLNDKEKTAKSFISDPTWAQGNGRRMYKTGDLGFLNSDGTITYMGRRDTQVKLNGQRLELGEIEHHVKKNLPSDITSSVELIKLGDTKALAAFLCCATPTPAALEEEELLSVTESLRENIVSLEASLSKLLPPYMVPTLFIPIKSMPLTPSGKLNRRQLRLWCESLSESRISEYRLAKKSSRAPSTPMELKLQALWETVLNLPCGSVRADDNWFSRGGDSIACMKLVVAARAKGITISVADVFQKPVLSDLAAGNSTLEMIDNPPQIPEDLEQFALIPLTQPLTAIIEEVTGICMVPPEQIQDIYPTSPLQEGLMALTNKMPGAYVAQNVYRLPMTINIGLFKEAWGMLFDEEAILRTRLVQTKDLGLLQAILHESITWNSLSGTSELTEDTRYLPSHEGGPLCQFSIIGENTNQPRFVLTAHHALYDGWSLPLLFEKLKTYYDDLEAITPTSIPYSRFINYLSGMDIAESNKFWELTLAETTATAFPALPNPSYNVQATSRTKITVPISRGSGSTITIPSMIRAAWALTMSIYSGNSDDVLFGETMTGRDAPIPGIARMIAPTLSTVPMRISIDPALSVEKFLAEVQCKSAAVIPFQHAGLQSITRLNQDTAMACSFQNLLVMSTTAHETLDLCTLESSGSAKDTFSSYPLSIICDISGDRVEVEVHYDQEVISAWLVNKVMSQFDFLLKRLNSNIMMDEEIGQITILNSKDQVTIQSWNSAPLKMSDNCVHDLFKLQVNHQSTKKPAVCSHDGTFTYRELDLLSTRLAKRIVELNPQCEIVPFCFEKSSWAIVAMLAIMKSGRAFVPLDHSAPTARLRDILNDTKSDLILCSKAHEQLCKSLVDNVIIINQQTIENLGSSTIILPKCSPNSPVYCIFTSGSTGKPKGTIIHHVAFCTSAAAHGPALRIKSTSRTLQFASYTFDVSLMEILTSLTIGATICVPSEDNRLNNIAEFIEEYQVTWAGLTPTLVKTLDPSSVPSLRTLVLGGESMFPDDIELWADKVDLISAYGPSEAAINTSCNQNITIGTNPANIGFATGSRLWVVDANNHDRLAPVGSVGELLIEGPLARGYLNDEVKTASAFIEDPRWSIVPSDPSSDARRMYKTGDLVRYNSDGSLLFFKRKDTQKKVHGQRLELGEVEHFLNTNSAVQHALAIVPSSGPLSSRLVAIISLKRLPTSSELTSGNFKLVNLNKCSAEIFAIQEHMCSHLPPYMIPTSWIVLEKLPFLSSGKLDRRQSVKWVETMNDEVYRLVSAIEAEEEEVKASELELRLRKIWGETLNLPSEKIGLRKSFLHLGGDSITAMQVMSRCRAKGLGVTVKNILQSKSIPELATRVTLPETQSFVREDEDVEFDLSPIQKLYFGSISGEKTHFNQSTIFNLSKRIDVEVVRRAIDTIVKTHSMLRARFSQKDNIWRQKTIPSAPGAYRFTSKKIATESLADLVEQSQENLNITSGPTFSVDLFKVGEKQVILLVAHHLVIDVVSWRVIIQDLEDLFSSTRFKVMNALPFQTWCRLQAEHALQSVEKSSFTPSHVPVVDFTYWGMENKSNIYADVVTKSFELDERISTLLLEGCHDSMNTEPVDVFLATVIYSLRSIFPDRPQTPTVFNEGHGREPWSGSGSDISRTVGWFTTITPVFLPTTVNGKVLLVDIIKWVKELRGRYADKGREYFANKILTATDRDKFMMEVSFNYLGKLQQLEQKDALLQPFHGIDNTASDIGPNTRRFSLLDISIGVSFGKLRISIGYNQQMKYQDLLLDFIAKYQSSLEEAAESLVTMKPQRTLSEFPLLPLTFGGIERLCKKLPELLLDSLECIEDAYKLSPMQQGILLSQQKNSELYCCEFVFEVRSATGVDPLVLAESWQEIVLRHPAMRTVFVDGVCQDGEMGQVVLRNHDANIVHIQVADDEVSNILGQQKPLQYSRVQPPHRLTICNTNTGRIICKLDISHAISDGTSLPIVFKDLSDLYRSKTSKDHGFSFPPAPLYSVYIAHISKATDAGLTYWKSYLDGIQPCHLPAINDGFSGQNRHEHEYLEITDMAPLRDFCAKYGLTLSNVLQLAWGIILRMYTGSDEVVFGYLTNGRNAPLPGLQDEAVGTFINMLVCRIDFSATNQLSKALQKMQKDFGDAMEYQSCSLAEVQHELQLSGIPLFNTAFTFQKQAASDDSRENQALKFDIIETRDPSEYLAVNAVATDYTLGVSFHYWTDTLSNAQAKNMARTFEHILTLIASSSESDVLSNLDLLSNNSRQQILSWNSTLPDRIEQPIHDLILQQKHLRPSATQAICSWDSSLTYAELDELATSLAFELVEAGVRPETYVPICFEKGLWSVVSILSILKAGGAFVPLDASHPESRLEHIINDVSAELVLCSPQYQHKFSGIASKVLAVDSTTVLEQVHQDASTLPVVSPNHAALILFTSGTSTGVPKGTIIEHGAFSTSAVYHARGMHIDSFSRVFQFASLTFDAGIMEVLTTLIVGGAICIPSDTERMNDISGAINRMDVNWMFSTPSLASTLSPDSLPSLKTLVLGGEAVGAADVLKWSGRLCVINGYGPSETTICSTTNLLLGENGLGIDTGFTNIGKAVTGRTWLTDPDNYNKLMPIGAIGELVIETRGCARAYLNNASKTKEAFIGCPVWLEEIQPRERVYKTGDLVRYNSDGSLNFISRKDSQIKINGQRIELAEIEHHVKQIDPFSDIDSVVELVSPKDGTSAIALFFCPKNEMGSTKASEEIPLKMSDEVRTACRILDSSLASKLPTYMIPSLFVPLAQFPLTSSSRKLDRGKLRNIVSSMSSAALAEYRLAIESNCRIPSTIMEKKLHALWANVLSGVSFASISAASSFFRLGGDSIAAMKLVVNARAEGVVMTVADVFRMPTLVELAAHCASISESFEGDNKPAPEPYTMIDSATIDDTLDEVASECQVSKTLIHDIYPCSPLQEALITLAMKEPGAYVAHHIFQLSADIDMPKFKAACQKVVDVVGILRTRVVHMESSEFMQTVLKESAIVWQTATSISDARNNNMDLPARNGAPLSRYTIVNPGSFDERHFVFSIQHALYDGWSLPAVFQMVEREYFDGIATSSTTPYSSFIRYLSEIDHEASDNFWKNTLAGASSLQFPHQKLDSNRVRKIGAFSHKAPMPGEAINSDVTTPSIIRAAWSLLVSVYSGSEDVVFGEVLAGRDITINGIEEIIGPIISIVPTRIQIDRQTKLSAFLQYTQKIATDVIPYQHAGLQRIKYLDSDTAIACDFQNLLVIQPTGMKSEERLWKPFNDGSVQSNFSTYPLMLVCEVASNEINITAFYDKSIMSSWEVERMMLQLDCILQQLNSAADGNTLNVGDIQTFSRQDKELVKSWNKNELEVTDRCLHHAFEQHAVSQPGATALSSWDGDLTYHELREHANRLAQYLVSVGIRQETFVPICMDRGKWVIISILAILMTGAAYVPLDPKSPLSRQEGIIHDINAKIALCSPEYGDRFDGFVQTIVIDERILNRLEGLPSRMVALASSNSPSYVIYTSGSSGRPKGVVIEHKAAATSIWSWRQKIMIQPDSRIFHFASLAFDASVMEIFGALTFGGTLCIPSEEQRMNFMVDSINDFKATWLFMTPSLANVIRPDRVPTLETLICGGEALTAETVLKWGKKATLINGYGPTETCILATINDDIRDPINIGHTFPSAHSWITDPHDHNRLAPVGCIGELCIEGAILSCGYLNSPKTSEVFITDPKWATQFHQSALGNVSASSNQTRRIYKTGDLVKYAGCDGSIIFLGRKDHQVKIRGQRIELGEIEHALDKDPHIRHGLVLVPKSGLLQKRLVAVVSLNELIDPAVVIKICQLVQGEERGTIARANVKMAQDNLSNQLPRYMVPATWLVLEAIPMSISSKLERSLIQRWVETMDAETYAIALGAEKFGSVPVTGTNKILQEVVARVLNIPVSRVKMEDSFMGAGGDSITAMQVMALCRKENIRFTLPDIIRSKSLFELASRIVSAGETIYQEEKLDRAFDLSPIQQAYVSTQPSMDKKDEKHFNQSFLLKITRKVQPEEMNKAVEMLVVQHSMLRAHFTESGDAWKQHIIEDPSRSYRFQELDLADENEIPPYINDSQSCLDIIRGPLFAVDIFNIPRHSQILFMTINHMVVDMVSWRIILQDLEEILTTGSLSASKPLSFQTWCSLQFEHSQKQIENGATGALPCEVPAPNISYWMDDQIRNTYGDTECETFSLSEATTKSILGDSNKPLRTEPVDLLLSAIVQSFSAIFPDRSAPAIHNESHGREPWDSSIDLSRTVGWFTTIFPIHISVDQDSDIIETVKRMKDVRRKIDGNGRPYFARRYLTSKGREEFKDHDGSMEIVFNYLGRMQQLEQQDTLFQSFKGPSGEMNTKLMSDVGEKTTRMALFEISAVVVQDRMQFSFVFNRTMKKQAAIREWIHEFRATLEETVDALMRIGSEPQFTLSDFPILPISYDGLQTLVEDTLPSAGISLQSVEDIYPCVPMQEGMLLSQLRDPAVYKFHAIFEVSAPTSVDARRLVEAWNQVVNRHSALRTIFIDSVYKEDVFNQVVTKVASEQGVFIQCEEKDAIERLESLTAKEEQGQPTLPHNFTVCQTSTGKVYFKLEMNHAIMDGGSLPVLFRDLAAAYNGSLLNESGPLYSEYVKYLRGQNLNIGLQFWKKYLRDARACHFPALNKNSATKRQLNFANLKFGRFPELVALCSAKKVTLANVMQAAWAVCLRTWTKSDDVCMGYLVSGRDVPVENIQNLFGPILNMMVSRIKFSSSSSLEEVVEGVQSDYLESLGHQHCSLAKIQHDLGLGGDSLFNTAVSIQGGGAPRATESSSITFTALNAVDPNEYAMTLNIGIQKSEEGAVLRYWSDILSDKQADILVEDLAKVLDGIVSKPKQLVTELVLASEPQKPIITQPTVLGQEAQIRMIVKECVQEILGQMFKSENSAHSTINLPALVNRQIAQPAASSLPQSMAEFSFDKHTENTPKKRSFAIAEPSAQANPVTQKLLALWSEYLQIPETSIKSTDSFFTLGADSIVAMQLVGSARDEGLSLSVANIFRYPVFEDMVKVTRTIDSGTSSNKTRNINQRRRSSLLYQNFSLLEQSDISAFLQDNVCPKIKLFRGGIVDVLPTTDFQALSITGSLLESRWLLNYFFLEGSGIVDLKQLRQSINQVVDAFEILRTVFIPYNSQFFQVVLRKLNPSFNVEVTDDLDAFTAELQQRDRISGPKLGESYLRFTVAKLRNSDNHRIIIRLSHAQYDGVCLPRIIDALRAAYHGETIPSTPSFSSYVRAAVGKTTSDHYKYWQDLLEESKMTDLVRRRGPNYSRGPEPPTMLRRTVKVASLAHEGITAATVVKAAWSLTLAELTADSDIIFGNVISGRNGSLAGVENIVGPCVNTVPVRAKFQAGWTALDLLKHLQTQQTSNMAYESLGFREIIKHCTTWENWTNFTTVCQHQNIQQTPSLSLGNKYSFGGVGTQDPSTYFTIISVPHGGDDIEITLTFTLTNVQMTKLATDSIFNTLCENAVLFSQNPSTILPTPSELNSLPRLLPEDASIISARRMSRSLDTLNRKHLLLYSDVLTRGWREILGEGKSIDSESSFFELGGDIMGLAQLGSLLEEEGFKVKLEDLVQHPVLMEQLALLARDRDVDGEEGVENELTNSEKGDVPMKVKTGMWGAIRKMAKVKGRKRGVAGEVGVV